MPEAFRGVFTIPSTPFDRDFEVDWEGLRRIVDFCLACGAHGIVWPVNASGFATLSDDERLRGTRVVVEQVAGRVPVVIGAQGVCTSHAVVFACYAYEVGADAVIAMPPYIEPAGDENALLHYYRGLSDAVDLPVFIQNDQRSNLSVETMVRIVRELDQVEYVKEETLPATHKLTQLLEAAGPGLKGVFGGSGGRYMLLEYPRGVAGQMPGCHVTDVVVRLWDALEAGDWTEAKRVYGRMAPLLALQAQCPGDIYKEVLRRRGVIALSHSRGGPSQVMDSHDHRALDDILIDLEPLFIWHA